MSDIPHKVWCLAKTLKSMFVPAVYDVNCCDMWHPGVASCSWAGIELLSRSSIKAVKIYTALYLLPRLLEQKSLLKGLKKTYPDVIRSSLFLSCNCVTLCALHCALRRILGHYRACTVGFVPASIAGFLSIGIEKQNRQEVLAIYMTSLAMECLYEMAVYRRLIPPIVNGEVALFSLSSAILVYFHRNEEIKITDTMDWLMKKFLSCTEMRQEKEKRYLLTRARECLVLNTEYILTHFTAHRKSDDCSHELTCLSNVLNTGIHAVVWGTIIQMCFRLLSSAGSLRQVLQLFRRRSDLVRVSSFIGLYSSLVVGIECLLNRYNKHNKKYNPVVAGLFAGLAFEIFPPPGGPVALYFFCRAFQCVYKKLIQDKVISEIPYDTMLLYSLALGITVHTSVCEPHLMRKSYTSFLNYLTDHKYNELDRVSIKKIMKNIPLY